MTAYMHACNRPVLLVNDDANLQVVFHASAKRPAGGGDTTSTRRRSLGHTNNIIFAIGLNYLTLLLINFAKHAKPN